MIKNFTKFVVLNGFAALLSQGCSTTSSSEKKSFEISYSIREASFNLGYGLMPSRKLFMVDWKSGDEIVETRNGAVAWDFDHDGRYEMIETYDGKGEISEYLFDFDGDGRFDLRRTRSDD